MTGVDRSNTAVKKRKKLRRLSFASKASKDQHTTRQYRTAIAPEVYKSDNESVKTKSEGSILIKEQRIEYFNETS